MGVTRALAELALQVTWNDIKEPARQAAKKMILDTLGTGLGGWNETGMRAVVQQMRHWGGLEEATLLTYGGRLPAPNAAFANSCMIHALDYDDLHAPAMLHIMSSVLPVSLAVAEMKRKSGADLIAAVVMGVEVAARIGIIAQEANYDRCFLPASTVGVFGATAAACRLLDLDIDQTQNALGICYAQTSGNRQALLDYTLTKRMQPAYAAQSALWSACLAERGITGSKQALEGEAGFFRLYVRTDPPDESQVAGLRDFFEIERETIKPFPSCGANHRPVVAAIELVKREGIKPEDIEVVDLWVSEGILWIVGAPFEIGADPQVDAQFSVTYSVAAGLVHQAAGPAEYAPDRVVSDTTVHDMIRRIRLHEIEGSKGRTGGNFPVTVTITTQDGRVFSNTTRALKGSPENPMSYGDVAQKFHGCLKFAGHWPEEKIDEIVYTVAELEMVSDVARFVRTGLVIPEMVI